MAAETDSVTAVSSELLDCVCVCVCVCVVSDSMYLSMTECRHSGVSSTVCVCVCDERERETDVRAESGCPNPSVFWFPIAHMISAVFVCFQF